MTATDTTRAKKTPSGVAQHLGALVFELLLLDRGDPFEDLQRVRGLLDLRLELAERDVVVVPSVGAGSAGSTGASQSPVSCGNGLAGPPRLGGEALLGPGVGTAQLRVEPARPAPPSSPQ